MRVNEFELINLLIVFILLLFIARKNNTIITLWGLFIYGALHFVFGLAPLINSSGISHFELHLFGGGLIANISAVLFLGICFIGLFKKSPKLVFEKNPKFFFFVILPIIFGPIFGYTFNYREGDWIQFKNLISIEALILFLMLGARALAVDSRLQKITWIYFLSLIFLMISGIVAIYEVINAQSWAGTLQSSGVFVNRASASLFNPNLLGFFASIVYLGAAYGWNKWPHLRWKSTYLWIFFSALVIYFSGSRSAAYILLLCLFVPIILLGGRSQLIPALSFPGIVILIYLLSIAIPLIDANISTLYFQRVSALGGRFLEAIPNLIYYLLAKTCGLFEPGNPLSCLEFMVLPEILESIDGRFVGGARDSGWATLYYDLGVFGVLSFIWGSCLLAFLGIKAYVSRPGIDTAYSLALFTNCLLVGIYMRFQNFPVWIFISVVMAFNLHYWIGHSTFFGVRGEPNAHSDC